MATTKKELKAQIIINLKASIEYYKSEAARYRKTKFYQDFAEAKIKEEAMREAIQVVKYS